METFVTLLASGIALGSILALTALGFLMLYRATSVVNFAQGDLVALGAYIAVWAGADLGLSLLPAYGVAIALMFLVGVAFERLAYAPLRNRPPIVMLIATLGAATVIRAGIGIWQGTLPVRLPSPVGNGVVRIAGASIAGQRILIVVLTLFVIVGLWWAFSRTQWGRQVRAVASDHETARLQGIRTTRLGIGAFGISAALAALAGVLIAPLAPVDPGFGFTIMLNAFAAAILGGFGNFAGVIIAAMAIGIVNQTIGGYYLPEFKDALPYLLMLAVISVRPHGLFVEHRGARL